MGIADRFFLVVTAVIFGLIVLGIVLSLLL
jgi:predicted tellurium resistance membrane protein TerC